MQLRTALGIGIVFLRDFCLPGVKPGGVRFFQAGKGLLHLRKLPACHLHIPVVFHQLRVHCLSLWVRKQLLLYPKIIVAAILNEGGFKGGFGIVTQVFCVAALLSRRVNLSIQPVQGLLCGFCLVPELLGGGLILGNLRFQLVQSALQCVAVRNPVNQIGFGVAQGGCRVIPGLFRVPQAFFGTLLFGFRGLTLVFR